MAWRKKATDPVVKLSKALSFLLRHGAEKEGFRFMPGGFLYVDEILKHKNFTSYFLDDILYVVENSEKKRFTLETDGDNGRLKIRANQGHSLEIVGLELQPIISAADYPVVIHGTYYRAYKLIANEGLKTMGRNHIHFAMGEPGENGVISGMRERCTVVIYLDLAKALEGGLKFFLSSNNVILCPGNEDGVIPTLYFEKVIDRITRKSLHLHPSSPSSSSPAASVDDRPGSPAKAGAVTAEDIAEELEDRRKSRQKKKNKKHEN